MKDAREIAESLIYQAPACMDIPPEDRAVFCYAIAGAIVEAREEAICAAAPVWKPIEDRPDFDHQPMRQFVRIEGSTDHSGVSWARVYFGEAFISKAGPFGYREEDIRRLCNQGDMSFLSARVTHWAPYRLNTPNI